MLLVVGVRETNPNGDSVSRGKLCSGSETDITNKHKKHKILKEMESHN